MGCNVCRCASENIEELLTDLSQARRGIYCLQETKFTFLLQLVLIAIVLLSYYGNEGGRLFFGLVDYLGVGIAVGFSIVIPLIFLSYLCDGNILIFVSGNYKYSLLTPFATYSYQHVSQKCKEKK